MREEIRTALVQYTDEKYKEFSAGLIPEARPLIGVRLPQLRQFAKRIVNDQEDKLRWQKEIARYDGEYEDIYFEETMLRGMLIGYGTAKKNCPCEEGLSYLKSFIPYIDNWSVCDSFCNSFTFANRYRDEVWEFLQPYLYSDQEYEVRVALILLLCQYLKYDIDNRKIARNRKVGMEDMTYSFPNQELSVCTRAQYPYLDRILATLNRAFHQGYYAQMAAAWLMAETFICFPYESVRMLTCDCQMDPWTYNKALQKIRESLNPDPSVKEYMKSLKKG
ncbi:MAG: DNA alkylation repair protein [Lachnospiraceae bacterium]|nr:DNA alkylation repair protein [Lachnospiraceae bacterium]